MTTPAKQTNAQFAPLGTVSAPADWNIPSNIVLSPSVVFAHFDGTSAAGSFVPTLQILSDSGHVVAEIPQDVTIAAGSSCEATWAPFLKGVAATSSPTGKGGFTGGGTGTISLVDIAHVTTNAVSGLTLTINPALPTGILKGDLLLIFIGVFSNVATTSFTSAPAGWSKAYEFNLQTFGTGLITPRMGFFRVADGTEGITAGNFTFTASASASNLNATAIAAGFRGVDQTTSGTYFFDGFTAAANASSWTHSAPATPVMRPNSTVIEVLYSCKEQIGPTVPAGLTEIASEANSENNVSMYVATKTSNIATSDSWTATILNAPVAGTTHYELMEMVLNPALS